MLKVLDTNLGLAIRILEDTSACRDTVRCLWGKLADKEACPVADTCPVLWFRKELEKQAPAFMGLYLKVSYFDSIMHDYALMEAEGDEGQKMEATVWLRDLSRFRYVSLLGLFTVYAGNRRAIPPISPELIEETNRTFSPDTIKELLETNPWVSRVSSFFSDTTEFQQRYKQANYLLLMVFLRAYEQDGAVAPLANAAEEAELFQSIESFLKIRRE